MERVEITAGRLHLRLWVPDDATAVYRACQDPEIQRWTRVPVPYRMADATWFTGEMTEGAWADGTGAPFAVLDATSGKLLASVAVNAFHRADAIADIGYWCAPWARGQGVVGQAVAAVCRWCFAEQQVGRVHWSAFVGNVGSLRVAEKCGFAYEGVARAGHLHRGERVDAWTAALLPEPEPPLVPDPGELTDGALALRRWRPSDTAELPDAIDADVTRWMALMPEPYTAAAAAEWVTALAPQRWFSGAGADFAVREEGRLVGGIGVTLTQRHLGTAEIGLWFSAAARGRGLGPRTTRLVADWAFAELGVHRLEWFADTANEPSRRAAVKAGFVEEGVRQACRISRSGAPEDRVVYVARAASTR